MCSCRPTGVLRWASISCIASVVRRIDRTAIRVLDVAAAAFLLLFFLPTFGLIAVGVLVESRGGLFYRCRRVGRHGRELQVLKFRKMHEDAGGLPLTLVDDERLTRPGRLLARWKLDELPQLWCVLRGDMSLVGPRPEDPIFVAAAGEGFREILAVPPGMTGLGQLAFANEASLLQGGNPDAYYIEHLLPQKLVLDRLYVRRRSFWLNVEILFWTARMMVLGSNVAVDRQSAALTVRQPRRSLEPEAEHLELIQQVK